MKLLRIVFIVLCTTSIHASMHGQSGTSTKGTDFWMGFMKNNDSGSIESLSLFITSSSPASGTVEIPGQNWSQNFVVVANATTTVTIPNSIAEVLSSQIVEGRSVHIFTDQPVSVYAINFETNTADATKILPTPALGTSYIATTYSGTTGHEAELLVVATENNTQVIITPKVSTTEGNLAGVPFQVNLQQGECYQVKAAGTGDLTGTSIEATDASGKCRPFAVFSGAGCSSVPANCFACDHIFEQNYPLELWGKEFYVTPWVFTLSPDWTVTQPNYTYRILAQANNTSINIDGVAAFNLNAGNYQEFNHEVAAHCIISNQPIAVIQYMEGIQCGGNGDPSMVILDDKSKKIDTVTFGTVVSSIITDHYLNVIINTADLGSVTLDGAPISASQFQSFPYCSDQVWCGLPISAGNHTLTSTGGGVTAYVYGNGPNESYAFSVGSYHEPRPVIYEEVICTNNDVTLELSNAYFNPRWYNVADTTVLLGTNYQLNISSPIVNAVYIVKCTKVISGCDEKFYYSVASPDPIPVVMQPASITVCEHQEVQLNALTPTSGGMYQYTWSNASSLNHSGISSPVASPNSTTTYNVLVNSPGSCSVGSGTITVTVNPGNIAKLIASPEEVSICEGNNVPLSVAVQTKIWSDDFEPGISWGDWESISNGLANSTCGAVSGNGLYFNGVFPREAITNPIDVTNGGTVYFALKIANGVAPCDDAEPGDNVVLSYSVNNGAWVNVQTFYESAYPDFVLVSANIPADALSNNTRFRWRQVGSYMANQDNWSMDNMFIGTASTGNYNYSWTPSGLLNNASSATPTATPTSTTMFQVTLTDAPTGCTYRDSIRVNVGSNFTMITTNDTTICDVQGIQLNASTSIAGNFTYNWTPSGSMSGFYGEAPIAQPTTSTLYQVTATSEEGCTATGDVNIAVSALLNLQLSASDSTLCEGEQTQLAAALTGNPTGVSYAWSPDTGLSNALQASTTATPASDITYMCTVTHQASGCQLTSAIEIEVTPAFAVSITPNAISSCVVAGMPISASSNYNGTLNWQWSPANVVNNASSSTTILSGNADGVLTMTATSESGCSAVATINVLQAEEVTNLGPDIGFCVGEGVALNAGWPSNYTVVWNTQQTTSSIVVTTAGVYHVNVTSPEGCLSEDEILVTEFSYPVVQLGADSSLCAGELMVLDAGNLGLNSVWSNGLQTSQINVTSNGLYTVTVDNGYCFASDEINISFHSLPVNPFDSEVNHCFALQSELELDAQNAGSTYLWNTGSTARVLPATSIGNYSVRVITEHNCSAAFGIAVKGDCPVTIYIPNSFTPDGDGLNDVWKAEGENILNFHMRLYNRWGELFFESYDIEKPWLGQRRDGEYYMEPGIYPYLIVYQVILDNGMVSAPIKVKGEVSLLR